MFRRTLATGMGVQLSLPAQASPASSLVLSLRAAPAVRWVLRRGWRWPAGEVQLACAQGPVSLWLPGLEGTVLAGANAMTRRGLSATQLSVGAITTRVDGYAQGFVAKGGDGARTGQHVLAFGPAEHPSVWLCSVSCHGRSDPCESIVTSLTLTGTSPHPPATAAARGVVLVADHPQLAAAGLTTALLLGCGWFLARRPRPRR
ncbi:MAG TPA: hypothetical protein ENK23_00630 [Sorangium sp.]|nr:hypothetical protein [Sorangium sp.]